jgi:hypothetical protein
MEPNQHLQITNLRSFNWENALHGMRNAKESWDRIDSVFSYDMNQKKEIVVLGPNDYKLATTLCEAGSEHRKFLRQIFISCDVEAPWYWWKEQETYQIGTTENSTSQMHKLGSRELTKEDFIVDDWDIDYESLLMTINNKIRLYQADPQNKKNWRSLIQMIPGSFIYRRTISLNYEVLCNQYRHRKNHKLVEWHEYLDQMIAGLPYPELFTLEEKPYLDPNGLVKCVVCGLYFDRPKTPNQNWYLDKITEKVHWVCNSCNALHADKIPDIIRSIVRS